jgi:hypothetical protein
MTLDDHDNPFFFCDLFPLIAIIRLFFKARIHGIHIPPLPTTTPPAPFPPGPTKPNSHWAQHRQFSEYTTETGKRTSPQKPHFQN